MSKKISSGLTIGFLVIGLVAGVAGGYFFSSSSLQPRIDDLNSLVNGKNVLISQLNATIIDLQTQNANLNSQVTNLRKAVADRDDTIQSLNDELHSKDSIIISKDSIIASKDEEINWLQTFSNSTLGYFRVNTYGFAFDYPFNFNLSVTGLRDASANTNSGVIGMKRSDVEYISIAYAQWDTIPNLDDTLDQVLSSISNLNPTVGPRVSSSMSGYIMKYQTVNISASGETGYGAYGYAYCTKLGYYFGMVVFSASETQTMEWFNHIVDTFALPQ